MANKKEQIKSVFDVMEDESDSSDYEDIIPIAKKRRVGEEIPRISDYVEETVSRMSASEFKSHFRLLPETVESIQQMISQDAVFSNAESLTIMLYKQILMTLWILATPDSFRSVAERFGVAKSTLWFCFSRVCAAIARLSPNIIKWPSLEEMRLTSMSFEHQGSFPGVIGCIDGTHIKIRKPATDPEVFINRKGFPSFILQGIVNNNLEFINCYVGEVGSVHDATVFRNSEVGQNLSNRMPEHYHLLGDKAYPLSVNLITPFRDNGHLTNLQINFNQKLSRTRSVVERCFGILKGRFRRLQFLDMQKTDFLPTVIMAACVLHNISRKRGEDWEPDCSPEILDDDDDEDEDETNISKGSSPANSGAQKRDMLMKNM